MVPDEDLGSSLTVAAGPSRVPLVHSWSLFPPSHSQLWALLEYSAADGHPDAHACHLKLSLVVSGAESVMTCPWALEAELESYVLKVRHVSPGCRLSLEEELLLLDGHLGSRAKAKAAPPELRNRRALLKALQRGVAAGTHLELEV